MKKNNFFEELKRYFDNTPKEQVLADWRKSEELDKVGATVEEFVKCSQQHYNIHLEEPLNVGNILNNNNLSSEFTSGFFLIKNLRIDAKSCIFN